MMLKRAILQIVSILLLCIVVSGRCYAQPTLPDLSGSANKGVVLLSWTCQYTGVKAIAVLRSTDSIYNFKIIGYVKKLEKGVQAYVDGHADTGKNFYKLSIVFNSGLTWTSNRRSVYIDVSKLGASRLILPTNETLQRFIVTEELYKPGQVAVPSLELKPDSETLATMRKPAGAAHKVSLSFEADSTDVNEGALPRDAQSPSVRKKLVIAFDEPDMNTIMFVKSIYIFTDPRSGHIRIELPDDVRRHKYSVQFFDQHNHQVLAVPAINEPKVVIDKRNFQRKGAYKFLLKKDGVELETGYVSPGL